MNHSKFTVGGIIIFGAVLWASAQSASAQSQHLINLFLFVLLASMILINWEAIRPYIIKN